MIHRLKNNKSICKANINGKWIEFDFQSNIRNFDKEEPQLDLEYLGHGFYYTCDDISQGRCGYIFRRRTPTNSKANKKENKKW